MQRQQNSENQNQLLVPEKTALADRDPNELLLAAEVAPWLHQSVQALAQMRYRGTGPRYIKVSARKVLYRKADVDAWIESRSTTQTGQV